MARELTRPHGAAGLFGVARVLHAMAGAAHCGIRHMEARTMKASLIPNDKGWNDQYGYTSQFDPNKFAHIVKAYTLVIPMLCAKHGIHPIASIRLGARGLSGVPIALAVAANLGCKVSIVRKSDGHHSGFDVEGDTHGPWIFIDDFISTGETLKSVKKQIGSEPEFSLIYSDARNYENDPQNDRYSLWRYVD